VKLRAQQGKLKIEHSIVDGLRPVLEKLVERDDVRSVIPGVIRRVRDAKGKVKVHVTVPVTNGWKAIGLASGARQEFFVSTQLKKDELENALTLAGAIVE
jgi:hypothetical protein